MIKRKRYFWLMAVWLCLFCFSSYGAAGQAWDDVDVSETPAPYREIIQKANSMILNGVDDGGSVEDGYYALSELGFYLNQAELLDQVGYAVQDLSGDGVPELIIGEITRPDMPDSDSNLIYALYTLDADDQARVVFEGWYRNAYRYAGDGRFMYLGAGGAASSMFGMCGLTQDGKKLIWSDYYFTIPREGDYEIIDYYYNTSGKSETQGSQRLDISEDAFWQISDRLQDEAILIELAPFRALNEDSVVGDAAGEPLRAEIFANTEMRAPESYDHAIIDQTGFEGQILFTAERPIYDFQILSLELLDVTQAGELIFDSVAVYEKDAIQPERPLLVSLTFFGDLPSYGFSYTDESGDYHRSYLGVSGRDGSLVVRAF